MKILDALYWTQTKADGSPRSLWAIFLDPVGICIQPTDDLQPFRPPEEIDVAADDVEPAQSPVQSPTQDSELADTPAGAEQV